MNALELPLSLEEVKKRKDEYNYLEAVVAIGISEIYNHSYEEFIENLSSKLIGRPVLMDLQWTIVGNTDGSTLLIQVSGDTSELFKDM